MKKILLCTDEAPSPWDNCDDQAVFVSRLREHHDLKSLLNNHHSNSSIHVCLLAQAFRELVRRGQATIDVKIGVQSQMDRPAYGYKWTSRACAGMEANVSYPEPIAAIFRALVNSRTTVRKLDVANDGWMEDFVKIRANFSAFLIVAMSLEELRIKFNEDTVGESMPSTVQTILLSAGSLQRLSITGTEVSYTGDDTMFKDHRSDAWRLIQNVWKYSQPTLRHLSLHGAMVQYGQLKAFIEKHPSLETLELVGCGIWVELPEHETVAIKLGIEQNFDSMRKPPTALLEKDISENSALKCVKIEGGVLETMGYDDESGTDWDGGADAEEDDD
jgi:hypothetical protein